MGKGTTKEMTSGSTMKLILGFAVPLLMGMLFQQVYGLVDTIIVGRFLGVSALAAVGATGSINFLIIGFCQGICNGFALPIAQRFGARDYDGLRKYVGNSAVLSILFGGTLTVLTVVFCRDILLLMRTPSDIIDEVQFKPAKCKYRVYIIDEVHMLTTEAFNALLKTLEIGRAHV